MTSTATAREANNVYEKEEGANPMHWLTVNEAAAYLKVKPATLLLWARQGKIRAYALSGSKRRVWRFLTEDLDASLQLSQPMVVFGSGVRAQNASIQ